MVARLNGVQEAAGSNPVTRTRKSPEIVRFQDFFFIFAPKSVLYIDFIPERVPEIVPESRLETMDAMGRFSRFATPL